MITRNKIFITKACLMFGDYQDDNFVQYPKGKKVYLYVSFEIDKSIENKLGFIYITPDEFSSSVNDHQHVTKLNQRKFFFELSAKSLNLLKDFKIAAFETNSIRSNARPVPKDQIYISSLIIDEFPPQQLEFANIIRSDDGDNFISFLKEQGLFESDSEIIVNEREVQSTMQYIKQTLSNKKNLTVDQKQENETTEDTSQKLTQAKSKSWEEKRENLSYYSDALMYLTVERGMEQEEAIKTISSLNEKKVNLRISNGETLEQVLDSPSNSFRLKF